MAEIITVTGLLASVLQLFDTVGKARACICNFRDAPAEQQKLFLEVQNLQLFLEEFQKGLTNSQTIEKVNGKQQLTDALVRLERTMKRLMEKLDQAGSHSGLSKLSKRITWTFWDKKDVEHDLDEIERFKSWFNGWLAMHTWSFYPLHVSLMHAHTESRDATQQRERQNVIQWLSPLNFFPKQDAFFGSRQDGTGQWLLSTSQMTKWESRPGENLWCFGMRKEAPIYSHIFADGFSVAGAGKTVLACEIRSLSHILTHYYAALLW